MWQAKTQSVPCCNELVTTNSYILVHDISILVAYAQMPLINAHTDVFGEARGLNFGLGI